MLLSLADLRRNIAIPQVHPSPPLPASGTCGLALYLLTRHHHGRASLHTCGECSLLLPPNLSTVTDPLTTQYRLSTGLKRYQPW
jgi:hypothetical protein